MNIFTAIGLAAVFALCLAVVFWALGLIEIGCEIVEGEEQ